MVEGGAMFFPKRQKLYFPMKQKFGHKFIAENCKTKLCIFASFKSTNLFFSTKFCGRK